MRGRHTGLVGERLKAFIDVIDKINNEDNPNDLDFIDDIVDDIVRVIADNNDIANYVVRNVVRGVTDLDAIKDKATEFSPDGLYSTKELLAALNSDDMLKAIDDKDIVTYIKDRVEPNDVFDAKKLEDWAECNGYELTTEEAIDRVHR